MAGGVKNFRKSEKGSRLKLGKGRIRVKNFCWRCKDFFGKGSRRKLGKANSCKSENEDRRELATGVWLRVWW